MSNSEGNAPAVKSNADAHEKPSEPPPPAAKPPTVVAAHHHRRWWLWIVVAIAAIVAAILAAPVIRESLHTVDTDDAFINGHVTFVAPRVPGQVARVLVDDNNRVHQGDLLVQLDPEPLQVQVDIAQATVTAAQADLLAAQAQTRGFEGQTRSLRFGLERAIEDVNNQVALLRSKAAILDSRKATLARAQADYARGQSLVAAQAVGVEELDARKEAVLVSQAGVQEALEDIYQVRVSLGLPPKPATGDDLTQVPPDLDQTFSSVRQAQASLIQSAAQIGVFDSFDKTPRQMVADFYKRDPGGDIDKIYAKLLTTAPGIKQAQAKLAQAQSNLAQAQLNLRYCNVVAPIDGVVTRRDVNPGNNVVVGQGLMAIRSLTDIWVDANFKETQLRSLRIGQPVALDVDMYGRKHQFKGRISGFTMGTGSTLALLPAENATGNFVKVVQRLPVRIDFLDYDPDKQPLFVGLSVTPRVDISGSLVGPDAGKVLQPYLPPMPVPAASTEASSTALPETQP
jgi:membrane fusion protein (multidrug efflux system)